MDRKLGVTYGLAYGDALGRPTEFIGGAALAKFGSPFRPHVGLNRPQQGIVTDDTQMSIAVGQAALMTGPYNPKILADRFAMAFINWYDDPRSRDGRRAPGSTCLSAVARLKKNPRQWLLATRTDSKGNGANMRVAPLALRTDWTYPQLSAAAQLQAALTHGHATALAAADLTAVAVRMLLEGVAKPGSVLLDHLLAYAHDQRAVYHGDHLGGLWEAAAKFPLPGAFRMPQVPAGFTGRLWEDDPSWPIGAVVRVKARTPRRHRPAPASPQEFIERGWDKIIDSLLAIYDKRRDQHQDPCKVAGEGWVAEEALMVALHTLLCFPDDPTNALRRAAFTSGDSDSIASITGALAGAAYGRKAFPASWIPNLEYRREMDSLTARLDNAARGCR
jgi:ADP-ribosylglycohydrolase